MNARSDCQDPHPQGHIFSDKARLVSIYSQILHTANILIYSEFTLAG